MRLRALPKAMGKTRTNTWISAPISVLFPSQSADYDSAISGTCNTYETSFSSVGCRLPSRHRKCSVTQLSYLPFQLSESESFFFSDSSSLSWLKGSSKVSEGLKVLTRRGSLFQQWDHLLNHLLDSSLLARAICAVCQTPYLCIVEPSSS